MDDQTKTFHDDIVKIALESSSSVSSSIEKTTTWFLTVNGATAGLIISNIDKLAPIFTRPGVKNILYIIVIAIVCGLYSKYKAIRIKITTTTSRATAHKVNEYVKQNNSSITHFDLNYIMDRYIDNFPRFVRWHIKRKYNKNPQVILKQETTIAKATIYQLMFAALQIVFTVISIFMATYYIV